jgi:uncharacterized protein YkwD
MKKLKGFWEGVADAFSFITTIIVLVMILIMLSACSSLPPDLPTRNRSDIVAELNQYRIARGLTGVTTNPKLDALANERARHAWQYRNGNLAKGHSGFGAAIDRISPPGLWFGENLYAGPHTPTARGAVQAWHDSDGHRRMMIRPTTDDCSAAETFDEKKSVVALICSDRKKGDML